MNSSQNGRRPAGLIGGLRALIRERRGNVAAITAILLIPLIGAVAMGTEVAGWFMVERAEQNTADTAVIAAATQGANGAADYVAYGQSVTAKYGFTNGAANNTTVTVTFPITTAKVAACNPSCYEVQITKVVPIHLVSIVGYHGDGTLNGGNAGQKITATALATTKTVLAPFCLMTLNGGIVAHGIPNADLTCNIFANGNADCTGHNLTSGFSDATGNQNSCGNEQVNIPTVAPDPYASLASNIPPNPCSSYHPEGSLLPAGNKISGTISGAQQIYCGDVQLVGNVTITNASDLMVIENGQLDTNGFTITTATGAGATVVFNGPAGNTYTGGGQPANFITGNNGTSDIAAPTSGTWSGIAVFQNAQSPNAVNQTSLSYAGNSPTYDITGVIDAPGLSLSASGAVNKSSNGASCFTLIVGSLHMNGTGDLLNFPSGPQSQCQQAGVTQLLEPGQFIGQLVY